MQHGVCQDYGWVYDEMTRKPYCLKETARCYRQTTLWRVAYI